MKCGSLDGRSLPFSKTKLQPSAQRANCYRFFTLAEVIEADDFQDLGLKLGSTLTMGPLSQNNPLLSPPRVLFYSQ
jgi:hypothetical protein